MDFVLLKLITSVFSFSFFPHTYIVLEIHILTNI
jgi:hypothetical protein